MIQNEQDAAMRADSAQARDDSMVACMERHGITLPRNAVEWRTDSRKGELRGLSLRVHLLCTDGVVAWALTGDEKVFFCHLSNFVEDKPEKPVGVAKPRDSRASKRESVVLSALESLLS